jgi:trypsin
LGRVGRGIVAAALLASPVVAVSGSASGAERIVGGSAIQVQSAPWAVFVKSSGATEQDECSGSIIDAQHVLTAAHCVFTSTGTLASPSQLSVVAGVSNFASPLSTDMEQDRSVSSFTVHPGYTWSSTPGPDDVAVLALATPLTLGGPAVQAVALPGSGASLPVGAAVGDAGFGEESPGVDSSGQLNWLTGTVDQQGACGSGEAIDDDATRFCAASPTGSLCEGDSGSGLVTTGSTPTLIGVLSAGVPGCAAGTHSEFTYVAAPEILSFIQGNQSPPIAPREVSTSYIKLTWLAPLAVGTKLTCATGDWTDQPTSYSYAFANTQQNQTLQQGAKATFVLTTSDVGDTVSCTAYATNAGGTAALTTMSTNAVAAASASTTTPAHASTPSSASSSSASSGSTTARAYNAETIEAKADAIPLPLVRSGKSVDVPQWNGYLRQALLGNQNPYGLRYRDTYVRCWSGSSWAAAVAATAGATTFASSTAPLGFTVRGSSWIDVPAATCLNAAKAAKGELDATTVIALGSVLHETLERQGVSAAAATCLGAVGVWQAVNRHVGSAPATRALATLLGWYVSHLPLATARGLVGCASRVQTNWNG